MAHLLNTTFIPTTSSSLRRHGTTLSPQTQIAITRKTQIQSKIREIFMLALSSTMTEDKIISWVKSKGNKLSKGESVVVVESYKVDMDVETFYDGYLAAIIVEEGNSAPIGSATALLAENEDEISQAKSKASGTSSSSTSSSSLPPPMKTTTGDSAPVSPIVEKTSSKVMASSTHSVSEGGKKVVASPYAKKLAKELKVDLSGVVGSGPMGRFVCVSDVLCL